MAQQGGTASWHSKLAQQVDTASACMAQQVGTASGHSKLAQQVCVWHSKSAKWSFPSCSNAPVTSTTLWHDQFLALMLDKTKPKRFHCTTQRLLHAQAFTLLMLPYKLHKIPIAMVHHLLHHPLAAQPNAADRAAAEAAARAEKEQPKRWFEEWRPQPLVCKRFNVPGVLRVLVIGYFMCLCENS